MLKVDRFIFIVLLSGAIFSSLNLADALNSTYVGVDFCKMCHTDSVGVTSVFDGWNSTRHATAYTRKLLPQVLAAGGDDTSVRRCVPCHTAGFSKGGYASYNTTPQLINIQCENCHGAGSRHEVEANVSSFICGDCHSGSHRPTIEEWNSSAHAGSLKRIKGRNAATYSKCLECHSGDYRLASPGKRATMPDATNTTLYSVTCAVCHDSHSTANQSQLRAATPKDVCAQCHFNYDNRGPGYARPPHNFQLEMREGRGGINVTSIQFMQAVGCEGCHMFKRDYISASQPAITGHTFLPNLTACKDCHVREANLMQAGAGNDTLLRHITLNILRAGRNCDTCHSPGGFSAQGFIITWQGKINDEINKTQANLTLARNAATTGALKETYNKSKFSLDIVNSDKSRGIHNPEYALALLRNANTLANEVISGIVKVPLSPELVQFDRDGNGLIDRPEATDAVVQFFNGFITRQNATAVVVAFFG